MSLSKLSTPIEPAIMSVLDTLEFISNHLSSKQTCMLACTCKEIKGIFAELRRKKWERTLNLFYSLKSEKNQLKETDESPEFMKQEYHEDYIAHPIGDMSFSVIPQLFVSVIPPHAVSRHVEIFTVADIYKRAILVVIREHIYFSDSMISQFFSTEAKIEVIPGDELDGNFIKEPPQIFSTFRQLRDWVRALGNTGK